MNNQFQSYWKTIIFPFFIIVSIVLITFLIVPGAENFFNDLLNHNKQKSSVLYSAISFLILSSDIILPIPSSIVIFINGLILGFIPGALLSLLASLTSSSIGYLIGRKLNEVTDKFVSEQERVSANKFINKYGSVGIIISRGIPILSEAVVITVGQNLFSFKKFMLANFLGYLPVCIAYAYLGSISLNKEIFIWALIVNLAIAALLFYLSSIFLDSEEP